jgi:hypothetical protein
MGGKHDNKDGHLNQGHPFPMVLGYKRSDIRGVDRTKFTMHLRGY